MIIFKYIFKVIKFIIGTIIFLLAAACIWHNGVNIIEDKEMTRPGDKIEVYDNLYMHAVKMGEGDYTIVLLPGMGTASPYYDYYNLATELSKENQVIVVEPYGYGFSDDISKKRSLDNYEYELSTVLDYYQIKNNIILLGHSYSGISNFNYSNNHGEVKGLVCLDCTTEYQVETHVEDGKFKEEVPKTSGVYAWLSPLGITRVGYTFFLKSVQDELLEDIPSEYHDFYKHFLYNKTMNRTIIREIDDIPANELALLYKKYREDLYVTTILSDKTIESMKADKEEGYFNQDWEEMHNHLISNPNIQKIYTLKGNHYIHHGNVEEISFYINNMISSIKSNN